MNDKNLNPKVASDDKSKLAKELFEQLKESRERLNKLQEKAKETRDKLKKSGDGK
jgi:hypothetical protein